MTLQPLLSGFPYIWGNLFFLFLSVYACLLIHRDSAFTGCGLSIFNLCLYWLIHKRPFLCLMSSLHCSPGPPRALPGWGRWSSGGDSWNWPGPSVSAVQMSKRIKEMSRTGRVFASHFKGLDVWLLCTHRKLFYCISLSADLSVLATPYAYVAFVAHYVFLRDDWIRTQRAAFASKN